MRASFRRWWIAPAGVGIIGVALSCFAFWAAERADERRVRTALELRSEWRARDFEAKIRLAGEAVAVLAVAIAAGAPLDQEKFVQIATRARNGDAHVHSLQWAPRVARDQIAAFERSAQASGLPDYRVFDVTPDFRRTELTDRAEYFPVLYDARFGAGRHVHGLALGRHDGRRIPMLKARQEGVAVATPPVRPIGAPTNQLVFLLFWPVYDGVIAPNAAEPRADKLRGYALGNFNITELLNAAIRNTPEIVETIRISIAEAGQPRAAAQIAASYSPAARSFQPGAPAVGGAETAIRIERSFAAFGQQWDLAFDFSSDAISELRSPGAWGWLAAGLLLTTLLVFHLVRERGRREAIAALVAERTAELERTSAQLHQAQKMEAIGNLTGGMAHDFNNLLTIIIGNLDLLEERIQDNPKAAALANAALQAGLRGADLTRQLLAFARRQTLEPKVTDINELVGGMTRLLRRILAENIEIKLITVPDIWPVIVDPAQLGSAIANLATNARDAMPDGGRLTVETKNAHLDADFAALNPEVEPGDYVLMEVSDTGIGMSAETLAHVFEPFFTTKEVGRGTGLGLSMVFGFVKQSRGHIKIYSELGHGTVVRLYLPRAAQGADAPVAPAVLPPELQANRASILVVEDNAEVRSAVVRQITELGHAVLEAADADAALALLKNSEAKVDLLFTDLVMPGGMNGHELARAAVAERPALKVLFTSGYPGTVWTKGERAKDGEHFLGKPYRKQDLARKLAEILGS
jgi:signal transduction histidine kinase/CheY-like chemotaxis protein